MTKQIVEISRGVYDHRNPERSVKKLEGLNEEVVKAISEEKQEPEWILQKRLNALKIFLEKPLPKWGPDLTTLDFQKIRYYLKPEERKNMNKWEDVPDYIKKTFEELGIPEAEKKALAGAGAMYESEVMYHNLKKEWGKKGVIFEDMDVAIQKYPELVKKYFMTDCVPINDHKFAALHGAVWSGGCLTEESMVFTTNPGIKSIKDITENDKVFVVNKDNKLKEAKVLAKVYSGKKRVYRMLVAGRALEATANHKFLCLKKIKGRVNQHGTKWIKVWKPLEHIKPRELLAITKKLPDFGKSYTMPSRINYLRNKHLENSIKLPRKTNENLMWFLGILLGDGNVYFPNKNMCFINIAIPSNSPLRKETIRVIKSLFGYTIKVSNWYSLTIYSKQLGYWLKEIGMCGTAKSKQIPNWAYRLPLNERFALLGGLLDSDGWVEKGGQIVRFELANELLIKQIKLLAISCGIYSNGKILKRSRGKGTIKEGNALRIIKGGPSFSCRLTGDLSEVKTRHAEHKKILGKNKLTFDKYRSISGENFSSKVSDEIGFAPLKQKVFIGVKDVYDIQVENHHNFIANGIVAHNSFIYIPKDVKVTIPLQAYFRMNAPRGGQFEHTLIIADESSEVSYIEACSSPIYNENSIHAGCVEIFVHKNARVCYNSIENWSRNTFNLNTKRAVVEENGVIEFVNGNFGSHTTMLYPCSVLKGKNAKSEFIGIAYAGKNQNQDTGHKVLHLAPNTSSTVVSKSISKDGGITTYRGIVHIAKGAKNSKCKVQCDALMLDNKSISNTIPYMDVKEQKVTIGHEASVGKIDEEKLFYLMSRGLKEEDARKLIVSGFVEPISKQLPMEYALELNRLVELEMETSLG